MSDPRDIRIGWAAKAPTPKLRVHGTQNGAHNWSNSKVNILSGTSIGLISPESKLIRPIEIPMMACKKPTTEVVGVKLKVPKPEG